MRCPTIPFVDVLLSRLSFAGTWFGVEGLIAAGEAIESPAIMKAVDLMLTWVVCGLHYFSP